MYKSSNREYYIISFTRQVEQGFLSYAIFLAYLMIFSHSVFEKSSNMAKMKKNLVQLTTCLNLIFQWHFQNPGFGFGQNQVNLFSRNFCHIFL